MSSQRNNYSSLFILYGSKKKNKKYHNHSIEGHQTDRGLKCLVITVSKESCFEAAGFLEGRDLLSNEKA